MVDIMTYPRARQSRKILVASIGVATMSYVISCGGSFNTPAEGGAGEGGVDGKGDTMEPGDGGGDVIPSGDGSSDHPTIDESPVANLVVADVVSDVKPPKDATTDTIDDFPVANLVAIPDVTTVDEFPVANLVVTPDF